MVLCTVCFYSIGVRIRISRLQLEMTVLTFFAYILLNNITTNTMIYELVLIVRVFRGQLCKMVKQSEPIVPFILLDVFTIHPTCLSPNIFLRDLCVFVV